MSLHEYTLVEAANAFMGAVGFKRLAAATRHVADEYTDTAVTAWSATSGADLVTNGAFAADTDWTKGTGWTIAAGVGNSDASQVGDSDLTQTISITAAVEYQVVMTVANRTAGNVTPVVGDTEGTDRATNATFTEVIAAGAGGDIDIRADLDWDGDVDDVTVYVANTYTAGDYVSNGGSNYVCILTHTAGVIDDEPGVGGSWTTNWKLLVLHTDVNEFITIQAIAGTLTLGTACAVVDGDAPTSGDTLTQDATIRGRFTTVDITTGVAYAWYR